jgi:hypothetical protein
VSESISGEAMRAAILIVVAESPAADESPDHGLRRVHALGVRPARARASIIAAASEKSSSRAL